MPSAFVVCAVLAGGNAVGVRFSNRELDPLWGAGLRFSLAAACLVALMGVLRLELPRGRALVGSVLYGLLHFGAGFALAYYALVELYAGFAQILLSLVPLATLLLATAQGQERLHRASLAGTLLALVGVAVMSGASLRESIPVLSLLAALASALCVAQAAIIVRRIPPVHPVSMSAIGMAVGAVVLLLGAAVAGETFLLPREPETLAAIAFLVLVGSVVVFILYLFVLRYWVASRAAYGFVLTTVVTVALSAWLDDEPISSALVVGGALVLVGVYIGALRSPSAAPAAAVMNVSNASGKRCP